MCNFSMKRCCCAFGTLLMVAWFNHFYCHRIIYFLTIRHSQKSIFFCSLLVEVLDMSRRIFEFRHPHLALFCAIYVIKFQKKFFYTILSNVFNFSYSQQISQFCFRFYAITQSNVLRKSNSEMKSILRSGHSYMTFLLCF